MSTSFVLIVLAPNGRRETVKVTPNTSILQVLEDVCRKQGFNAMDYDLKHYNRIIEPANSVRFSGLPNKATLEMVQTGRPRQETSINLGLQLESGKRLMHPFNAQNTLWDVIKHWEVAGEPVLPHGDSAETGSIQPVCVYMRQEIVGEDQLQQKTLRSLGLTHGSACIRLLHRTVGQLSFQANVSAPLSRHSAPKVEEDHGPGTPVSKPQAVVKPQAQDLPRVNVGRASHGGNDLPLLSQLPSSSSPPTLSFPESSGGKKRPLSFSPVPMETDDSHGPALVEVETPAFPLDLSSATTAVTKDDEIKPRHSVQGVLNILGEHDAILYHADDVSHRSTISIPDSFFDITRGDVETIWRGLQVKRQELEDVPLSTSVLRIQERENAILRNLQLHPITAVRIRFQNRYVLQGIFRAVDTVGALINFVKKYLANPEADFYLFTSPPKTILDPEQRLVEQGLVGSAVVYFGNYEDKENPLNVDVCSNISCPDAVGEYLKNVDKREKLRIDPFSMSTGGDNAGTEEHASGQENQQPGPSSANSPGVGRPVRNKETSDRVPKWFKAPK